VAAGDATLTATSAKVYADGVLVHALPTLRDAHAAPTSAPSYTGGDLDDTPIRDRAASIEVHPGAIVRAGKRAHAGWSSSPPAAASVSDLELVDE
jgi:hypothetical protein